MKLIILTIGIITLCIGRTYSQTEQEEINYLSDQYEKGKITQQEYADMGKVWRETLSLFGGYPAMPFNNENKKILFSDVVELKDIPKKVIYSRIKEWIAITYGNIDAVLHYESLLDGKIIVKGIFEIPYFEEFTFWGKNKLEVNSIKSTQTYIYTIVDNKLKIETTNISYNFITGGYGTGSYYVPEKINEISIHALYPITSHEKYRWKTMLSILKFTKDEINSTNNSLEKYIGDYKTDYSF